MAEHEVALRWSGTKPDDRNDVQAVAVGFKRAAFALSGAPSGRVLIDGKEVWAWSHGAEVPPMRQTHPQAPEGPYVVSLAWGDGQWCEDNLQVITLAARRQMALLPDPVLLVDGRADG